MAQITQNTRAFIEAEQYSSFILTNMYDGLMPGTWYRNVSDFGSGETLNIKTIGSATLQDVSEDTPIVYNPIETGNVTLQIQNFKGDGWSVSDTLREDGAQIDQLMAARSQESTRAFQEEFETNFFSVCNSTQTDADANLVNGFAHRIASAEVNNVAVLKHFIDMKIAFDKAQVPYAGRVCVVDPVVAATLDQLVTINRDITDFGKMLVEQGFDRDHEFVMNLYGWNIVTSNRLAKGDFGDGTTTVTGGVANIFMSVLDDNTKPIMAAFRRMPNVEGERNKDLDRDEYVVRSRYGLGPQREDTLGILITSATNY
ncbi:MAG: putative minor capsid protein 10B [Prokaryotic dsDNA virus sp.]|nr:MAG: putative minor capsid protein 10B [Prokaryotic dsDNA virus sp.]|tara:strand:+ start:90 stop:1031 length:942 start_codon:yes stop_codon:yes gene_type:complete